MQSSLFYKKRASLPLLLIVIVLSIGAIWLDSQTKIFASVRFYLGTGLSTIYYVADFPTRVGDWYDDSFENKVALLQENALLRELILDLESKQVQMDVLEQENIALREQLNSSLRVRYGLLTTRIISISYGLHGKKFQVDKGTHDGVYIGQPVMSLDGIVGQVTHANLYDSAVLLISDPDHAIPVQVLRNGLRGVMFGSVGDAPPSLRYIAAGADIKVGDVLVSSGLGGVFPPDYPVATVASVDRPDGQAFAQVSVKISAKLEHNQRLLLVWYDASQGN